MQQEQIELGSTHAQLAMYAAASKVAKQTGTSTQVCEAVQCSCDEDV
jgi:hypothetical protein